MKTYNIIGDVHGRSEALSLFDPACINIYVGDYFSPYEYIPWEEQLKVFNTIIDYKKQYPETILLIGNHDIDHMLWITDNYNKCSRHDFKHEEEISKLFHDNLDLFTIAYNINDKYVVSHAGISCVWFTRVCEHEDVDNVLYNVPASTDIKEYTKNLPKVDIVRYLFWKNDNSYYKHGNKYICKKVVFPNVDTIVNSVNEAFKVDPEKFLFNVTYSVTDTCGNSVDHSPVWIRPQYLLYSNIFKGTDVTQIVGHTQVYKLMDKPIENMMLIDCLGTEPKSLKITIDD